MSRLRTLNPWSPENSGDADDRLSVTWQISSLGSRCYLTDRSMQCCMIHRARHRRELYAAAFYQQLARVLRRGLLFHYTDRPTR
jgi:predicted methyltransferase